MNGNELMSSIGSIADLTAIFYHELLHAGIPEERATVFTIKFIETFIGDVKNAKPKEPQKK